MKPSDTEFILAAIWKHFKRGGTWPSRKAIVIELDDRDIRINEALNKVEGIWFADGTLPQIRASIPALISGVAEVRSLLEPTPRVLKLIAGRFIEHHPFAGQESPKLIGLEDIRHFWETSESAILAITLLSQSSWGPLRFGDSYTGTSIEQRFERPTADHLRFEHADTLDEVLDIAGRIPVEVGHYPSGRPLDVIVALYQHIQTNKAWPCALPFWIENRSLGDIKSIISTLHPQFVSTQYGEDRRDVIRLTPRAALFADRSGELPELMIRLVHALAEHWKTKDDGVTLGQVSSGLGLSPAKLAAPALFLEMPPWGAPSNVDASDPSVWTFRPSERVLENRNLRTLEAYVDYWHPIRPVWDDRRERFDAWGDGNPSEGEEEISFTYVKDEKLRLLLERDLDELKKCVAVGAWKAAHILAGGIAEAALLDVLNRRADLAEAQFKLKRKGRQWPRGAGLSDLLTLAGEFNLVQPTPLTFAGVAKDYRDLIHPYNAANSRLRANQSTSRAVWHCLEVLTSDLSAAFQDGRISNYERR